MSVQMELSRIIISEIDDQQVVYLTEVDGDRTFPIIIGLFEAMSIDRRVKHQQTPRPLTHDLLVAAVEMLGGEFQDVVISELKEHTYYAVIRVLKDGEVVDRADLSGETVLLDASGGDAGPADPGAVREMLQVVATGAGVLLAPRPLLRALNARGTAHREIALADGARPTTLWLTWPKSGDDELTQELVGIVRGRREGSRRSALTAGEPPQKKLSAREKTLAKQARRQADKGGAARGGAPGSKRGGKPAGPGGRGKSGARKPKRRR